MRANTIALTTTAAAMPLRANRAKPAQKVRNYSTNRIIDH